MPGSRADEIAAYERRVARLQRDYRALPTTAPVRLGKRTSNLFRVRAAPSGPRLDVAGLDTVISVDPRLPPPMWEA